MGERDMLCITHRFIICKFNLTRSIWNDWSQITINLLAHIPVASEFDTIDLKRSITNYAR